MSFLPSFQVALKYIMAWLQEKNTHTTEVKLMDSEQNPNILDRYLTRPGNRAY